MFNNLFLKPAENYEGVNALFSKICTILPYRQTCIEFCQINLLSFANDVFLTSRKIISHIGFLISHKMMFCGFPDNCWCEYWCSQMMPCDRPAASNLWRDKLDAIFPSQQPLRVACPTTQPIKCDCWQSRCKMGRPKMAKTQKTLDASILTI